MHTLHQSVIYIWGECRYINVSVHWRPNRYFLYLFHGKGSSHISKMRYAAGKNKHVPLSNTIVIIGAYIDIG